MKTKMIMNIILIIGCFFNLNTHSQFTLPEEVPIASVYYNGTFTIFSDLEKGKNDIFRKAQEFSDNYQTITPLVKRGVANQLPSLLGIKPYPKLYREMMLHPSMYGPMYVSVAITNNGKVECRLYVFIFDGVRKVKTKVSICTECKREHCDYEQIYPRTFKETIKPENIFVWRELGKETFACDCPLVAPFIEMESKKQLDDIRNFIKKTVPSIILNKLFKYNATFLDENILQAEMLMHCNNSRFEKTLYERTFNMYALYKMVARYISPLLVVHVAHNGSNYQAYNQERLIYFDQKKNIAIVVDKKSKKIINVGRYTTEIIYLNAVEPVVIHEEEMPFISGKISEVISISNNDNQELISIFPSFVNNDPQNIAAIVHDCERSPVDSNEIEKVVTAFTEGVVLGVTNTIENIVNHPAETLISTVAGTSILVTKVAYDLTKIGVAACNDVKDGSKQLKEYIAPLVRIVEDIQDKNARYEVLKKAVAFAVHCKIQGKIIQGVDSVCNKIQSTVLNKQMITPEGITLNEEHVCRNSSENKNGGSGKNSKQPSTNNVSNKNVTSEKLDWTNHRGKHVPPKDLSWKKIVESTKYESAKYKHEINIKELEFYVWENGQKTTNNKNWKVFKFDKIIGAKKGKETPYIRVECNTNTIHGHPILEHEYLEYIT